MAKRPNPKKEKAQRNKAYARKFRKTPSRYSYRRGKGYGNNNNDSQKRDEPTNETNSDS